MSGQARLRVEMELLSDVIFGSGYSIPGGEDVALCQDDEGWPYLKGSAFKGLLRESLTNYLVWTGGAEGDLAALLGNQRGGWSGDIEGEWNGADNGRKVHLTPLMLSKAEKERMNNAPGECGLIRAFTSLENGTVRPGTLRQARCARQGLRFTGELYCAPEDVELLQKALMGIRWVGTMRSRGFGEVRVRAVRMDDSGAGVAPVPNARCVRFRIRTDTPVFITHLGESQGNHYVTRGYLPGAALRGFVMGALSASDPDWFAEHRMELLSDSVRFLDATPIHDDVAGIPSPQCFYEDKSESKSENDGKEIISVLTGSGDVPHGYKRAKLSAFCRLEGDTLHSWKADVGGVTRINRAAMSGAAEESDKNLFSVQTINGGQEFEGCFFTDNPELSGKISACLGGTVWLGADRYAGFGKCTVLSMEAAEVPSWVSGYGFRAGDAIPDTLYLLAVSPLSMLDGNGAPCGIDEAKLAKKLGVASVCVDRCAASLTEFSGYNRTWGCRTACASMYERGSVFRLRFDGGAPTFDALRRVETAGLGIRRAEGLGQVLFLRNDLFENIRFREKTDEPKEKSSEQNRQIQARRKRYEWLTDKVPKVRDSGLSKSQLGTLQSLCEASLSRGGGRDALDEWLDKNLFKRGVRHGSRFVHIGKFVRDTLDAPLSKTLSLDACPDSPEERLRLLIELFNFSRRGRTKE
ncbi:MAG: hypothetical protein IKO14_00250 [Oscillibacter sp.]|nr:hypothetical protein [Oscillibacter sp.]